MKFLIDLIVALLDWFMGKFWTKKRSGNGKNILLVEDDENDAKLARIHLLESGYELFWVKDKTAALDSMRRLKHRFVFIDVRLVRQSGWDVARAIRLEYPPSMTTICMLSGDEDSFSKMDPGLAVMTLVKSPNWQALVDAVRQAGI